MTKPQTPSQTAGPYVHIGCMPNFAGITGVYGVDLGQDMITGKAQGQRISVTGTVFDGMGAPLRDALVEIWQADANGRFAPAPDADPHFTGFGRTACDQDTGLFRFDTVKPGSVPFGDGRVQAPHITFWIVARGINMGLHTRMYFADEDNTNDPVLGRIDPSSRVKTLIATQENPGEYKFNIHLQVPDETVFFDV
ncbi:Protocatechuate 3,4-dioxygenase alpha chain (plasmid) [Pseudoseohaeicola sp. NH-UV-7]|uniref:protocatechuate 3,4-dioxygenase subunit alpha n=1 Tax=Sulfitobacter sp. TBRI5 TaxID=2989732 RepID=UPI003A6E01E9